MENLLRVLDSKNKRDQEIVKDAPSVLDYLDDESTVHFEAVKEMLDYLDIPYEIDTNMGRGLAYYNDTIFEVITNDPNFGANTTICAGGRYDSLVEQVGGPETPSFGFAIGLERLVMLLDAAKFDFPNLTELDAFIVTIGDEVNIEALKVVTALREQGLIVEREFVGRKPGAQFKTADKLNAKVIFTLGKMELENRTINMKLLETGKQTKISLDAIYSDNFKEIYEEEIKKLATGE